MKIIITALILFGYSAVAIAGEMSLFSCTGKETGKVKGYVAKEQLLLDCSGATCQITFGFHKFEAKKAEDSTFYSFAPNYFQFDPATGEAQGVVGEPYYYFVGTCKRS